jgi:hypothetical protein
MRNAVGFINVLHELLGYSISMFYFSNPDSADDIFNNPLLIYTHKGSQVTHSEDISTEVFFFFTNCWM